MIQQQVPEHVTAAARFLADTHQARGVSSGVSWIECDCGHQCAPGRMAAHRAEVVAQYVWLAAQVTERGTWWRRLGAWWARQRDAGRQHARGGWGRPAA